MLAKKITYKDYNGLQRTETFYFNLSKADIIEMQVTTPGGLIAKLQKMLQKNDQPEIFKVFKELILKSYGEKSDDGKRFIKVKNGVQLSEEFSQTEAYVELFMELCNDEKAVDEFINGIIPSDIDKDELARLREEQVKDLVQVNQ